MNLEDHLTDEVEEEEDTKDPSQPPWHISFTKVHPNEDVGDWKVGKYFIYWKVTCNL